VQRVPTVAVRTQRVAALSNRRAGERPLAIKRGVVVESLSTAKVRARLLLGSFKAGGKLAAGHLFAISRSRAATPITRCRKGIWDMAPILGTHAILSAVNPLSRGWGDWARDSRDLTSQAGFRLGPPQESLMSLEAGWRHCVTLGSTVFRGAIHDTAVSLNRRHPASATWATGTGPPLPCSPPEGVARLPAAGRSLTYHSGYATLRAPTLAKLHGYGRLRQTHHLFLRRP